MNAVAGKVKLIELTSEKGSYNSYANYPLIICNLGKNFNWRLTALIKAFQWYLVYENRSPHYKDIPFCQHAIAFAGWSQMISQSLE
jgi:hypothetical protein